MLLVFNIEVRSDRDWCREEYDDRCELRGNGQHDPRSGHFLL
jgi:hypothetical protein